MYDFLVVGAGPPGSRFAYQAATAGYDVALLEKGEVGKPLACSGHVSTDTWEYLPDGAADDLLQNRISGVRFHVGGPESKVYPFSKSEVISHVIDRVGLDKLLAHRAADVGTDLRDHHTVVDLNEQPDRVVVTVATPDGSQTTLEAQMVASCDGPTSRVALLCRLVKTVSDALTCVAAMQYVVENADDDLNIYNLGTKTTTSVTQIADIVSDELGVTPEYTYTGGDRGWTGDVPKMRLSIEKLADLGWEPTMSSDEAVRHGVRDLIAEITE